MESVFTDKEIWDIITSLHNIRHQVMTVSHQNFAKPLRFFLFPGWSLFVTTYSMAPILGKKSHIIKISKPNKDPNSPKSYQSIALLNRWKGLHGTYHKQTQDYHP